MRPTDPLFKKTDWPGNDVCWMFMDALEEVTIEKMGIYNSALFLSIDAQTKTATKHQSAPKNGPKVLVGVWRVNSKSWMRGICLSMFIRLSSIIPRYLKLHDFGF